jgi:uridine phosphorylase
MLLGNNLFEAFKEDVNAPVITVTVYADTFWGQFLDTACKLTRHAGKLIMKVPKASFERLRLDRLFASCRQALATI